MNEHAPPVVDRTKYIRFLNESLVIDPARTALLTIDVHRGHLDPEVATVPAEPELAARVTRNNARLCELARAQGIQVIHAIFTQRVIGGTPEILFQNFFRIIDESSHRFLPDRESTIKGHNLVGSPQTQLMPDLGPMPEDIVIDTKHRHSVFRGTDLEMTLRELDVETVLLTGINTNTCVHYAAYDVCGLDWQTVVVEDCVGSTYGDDLHYFALQNISRCLGWVLSADEVIEKVRSYSPTEVAEVASS